MSTPPIHPPRSISLSVLTPGVVSHGVTFDSLALPGVDESQRPEVEGLIAAAWRAIVLDRRRLRAHRSIEHQRYLEAFDGGGGTSITLSNYPLDPDAALSVAVGGEEVVLDDLVIVERLGIIERPEGWRDSAAVTYTAGLAPGHERWEDIATAVSNTVRFHLGREPGIAERASASARVSYESEPGYLPQAAKMFLEGL